MSDDPGSAGAHALAEACAAAMWTGDEASRGLGMVIERVGLGEAVLAMPVRDDMVNGHGLCHGGFIFALADSAFAFACNSHDQRTVAQHCAITYVRPGRRGERLVAHARELHRAGRSGLYDVTVRGGDGDVVAEFRGHSRTVPGTLVSGALASGAPVSGAAVSGAAVSGAAVSQGEDP